MLIMNEPLKKCPVCGEEGVIFEDLRFMDNPTDMHLVYGVQCSNPDCIMHQSQKFYPYEQAARCAWNKRSHEKEDTSDNVSTSHEISAHEDISYFSKLLDIAPDKHLEVWKFKNDNIICVSYADCDVKDGPFIRGLYGRGVTFEEACKDYYEQISEKHLLYIQHKPI